VPASTKPSLFHRIRLCLLVLLGLAILALVEPHSFCFLVKRAVLLEAARNDIALEIGSVEGSLVEPIILHDLRMEASRGAVDSSINAGSARVVLSWRALLPFTKGGAFFRRLTLDHTEADFAFHPHRKDQPAGPSGTTTAAAAPTRSWFPTPARIEVANSAFVFHMGKRKITFADVRFTISPFEPGVIAVEHLTLENSRGSRNFDVLRGTTALQGARWRVADLNLSDGVILSSVSSNLDDMLKGNLQVDFDIAAFSGSVRGDLLKNATPGEPDYEIVGNFSNIAVEALGKFLHVQEKTGGVIKEGKFTFQGSPYELENATVSTRFEATDFRWGSRQWNSLAMGATIVNRRVQIPELKLQQAHNTLDLDGEIVLPEDEKTPWWLTDFNFNIAAKIQNLGELSALFGPQFADASGAMTVDGSIRGTAKSYQGQLIVAGTKLTWRGVPFDLLNAGIKLDGNELQIINLEAAHGQDFVRGKGTLSILGERRYQGELNASIEELAAYRALLQKPIAPAPPGGGLNVTWSGDGAPGAHSGAFSAHFRKLRTLGTEGAPGTLPIDADLEGTYAPGGLSISQCVLANGDTRVEGRVAADEKTLKLEGVKLTQKKALWLEGDATLPFNLFQWWVNPSFDALAPDAPFNAQISAKGVQLEEVAHLTGRPIPIRGLITGTLKTESTLRALAMTGSVKLSKGQIPASDLLPALDKLEAEADIDGNVLRFSKVSASNPLGDFSATGSLDFSKFETPSYDFLVRGDKVHFNAGPSWEGTASLALALTGTQTTATAVGTAEITALDAAPTVDFGALISSGNPETISVPAPAISLKPPFDRWTYRIGVTTPKALPLKKGLYSADLRLDGTGSLLTAIGSVTVSGVPMTLSYLTGKLESGTWYLGPEPRMVARVSGTMDGKNFDGYFLGDPAQPTPVFWGDAPALIPGAKPLPENFTSLPHDFDAPLQGPSFPEESPAAMPPASPQPTP